MVTSVQGPAVIHPVLIYDHLIPTLIDEIPLVAAVLGLADGLSRLSGIEAFRPGPRNRVAETVQLLADAGISAHSEGGDLRIAGRNVPAPVRLVDSPDQHVSMAAVILATRAHGRSMVDLSQAKDAYPNLIEVLGHLIRGAKPRVNA